MGERSSSKPGFWDRVGIGVSGICAIHCLLVPVILSLLPLWPTFEELHGYTHLAFLFTIAPIVVLSLQKKHESMAVRIFLLSGLLIIFLAWVFNERLGEFREAGVTLIGSLFLISGHWLNYKSKRGS